MEVHHRKPRAKGGGHDLANLQVLCSGCHQHVHRGEAARAEQCMVCDTG
ncbi:HNH endonuclease [bacterium]|nr:HNH endonuclease [bacterium]